MRLIAVQSFSTLVGLKIISIGKKFLRGTRTTVDQKRSRVSDFILRSDLKSKRKEIDRGLVKIVCYSTKNIFVISFFHLYENDLAHGSNKIRISPK